MSSPNAAAAAASSAVDRCWICHHKKGNLQDNFCGCKGSTGKVHQKCLQQLINTQQLSACRICHHPYSFVFIDRNKKTPPPMPEAGFKSTTKFLFLNFVIPWNISAFLAIFEVLANWIVPAFLLSSVLLGASGGGKYQVGITHNYLDMILIGVIVLILKRRVTVGCNSIEAATKQTAKEKEDEDNNVNANNNANNNATNENQQEKSSTNENKNENQEQEQKQEAAAESSESEDEDSDDENEDEEEDEDNDDNGFDIDLEGGVMEAKKNLTLDRFLRFIVKGIAFVGRYPRNELNLLEAVSGTITDDVPILILILFSIGIFSLGFISFLAIYSVLMNFTHQPPKLKDLKNRWNEVNARVKKETTATDLRRYFMIYRFDVVLLYFFLPFTCGVVLHESFNFHPVNLLSSIYTRLTTEMIERPWLAVAHYCVGYVAAGLISAVESAFVAPIFAPGVSLIFFRSITINEEMASFKFMLVQLFDISIFSGLTHCMKLFSTYVPLIGTVIWILTNTLRVCYLIGYAMMGQIFEIVRYYYIAPTSWNRSPCQIYKSLEKQRQEQYYYHSNSSSSDGNSDISTNNSNLASLSFPKLLCYFEKALFTDYEKKMEKFHSQSTLDMVMEVSYNLFMKVYYFIMECVDTTTNSSSSSSSNNNNNINNNDTDTRKIPVYYRIQTNLANLFSNFIIPVFNTVIERLFQFNFVYSSTIQSDNANNTTTIIGGDQNSFLGSENVAQQTFFINSTYSHSITTTTTNNHQQQLPMSLHNGIRDGVMLDIPSPLTSFFSFALSCFGLVIAVGTIYSLPHQYYFIRKNMAMFRVLADKLGIHQFLFDQDQLDNIQNFLELSATLGRNNNNNQNNNNNNNNNDNDNVNILNNEDNNGNDDDGDDDDDDVNPQQDNVELQHPHVPIEQAAIRRERFVADEDIPNFLVIRVFIFTIICLSKILFDWIKRVMWKMVVIGFVCWILTLTYSGDHLVEVTNDWRKDLTKTHHGYLTASIFKVNSEFANRDSSSIITSKKNDAAPLLLLPCCKYFREEKKLNKKENDNENENDDDEETKTETSTKTETTTTTTTTSTTSNTTTEINFPNNTLLLFYYSESGLGFLTDQEEEVLYNAFSDDDEGSNNEVSVSDLINKNSNNNNNNKHQQYYAMPLLSRKQASTHSFTSLTRDILYWVISDSYTLLKTLVTNPFSLLSKSVIFDLLFSEIENKDSVVDSESPPVSVEYSSSPMDESNNNDNNDKVSEEAAIQQLFSKSRPEFLFSSPPQFFPCSENLKICIPIPSSQKLKIQTYSEFFGGKSFPDYLKEARKHQSNNNISNISNNNNDTSELQEEKEEKELISETTTTTTTTRKIPSSENFQLSLSGLELLAFMMFSFCFSNYPTTVAITCGYILVTPIALLFGVIEVVKPIIMNWSVIVESVYLHVYAVRRIVIPAAPRTTATSIFGDGSMPRTPEEMIEKLNDRFAWHFQPPRDDSDDEDDEEEDEENENDDDDVEVGERKVKLKDLEKELEKLLKENEEAAATIKEQMRDID